MKKSVFFTLAACFVMLLTTSCSKDIELPGTTWKANFNNNVTYMGIDATIAMDMTLNFTDATNYKMDVSIVMTAMGQSMPQNDSETGTYTFDGEKGMFDNEQAFTYDKKEKTIVVVFNLDDEEAEMFGTNSIVLNFKQQK